MNRLKFLLIFCQFALLAQESPISMRILTDTLYFNQDYKFANSINIGIKNNTLEKFVIPIDFHSYNLIGLELKEYEKQELFDNQNFIYPWLNITNHLAEPIYFHSSFNYIDHKNPYFCSVTKDEAFYEKAFDYALLKLNPKEEIILTTVLHLPVVNSEATYSNFVELSSSQEYNLWFELYLQEVHYSPTDLLKQLKKEGYQTFYGHLMSNQVKILNWR